MSIFVTPGLRRSTGALALAALMSIAIAGQAAAEDLVSRGRYLATIMDCGGCHTPGALAGQPDMAHLLGGSDIGFQIPGLGVFYPPNLTPDPETGIGKWSEAEIIAAIRTGVTPDGRELAPIMAWRSYGALSDEDAKALVAFLKSVPPFSHKVPGPVGEGEKPPLPYMTVVAPQ